MHHVLELLQTVGADGGLVVNELVDNGAGLEEMADDLRRSEVVVHGVVTLLAQGLYHLLGLGITFIADLNTLQITDSVRQFLQSLLCGLQSLIREVDGATIMR